MKKIIIVGLMLMLSINLVLGINAPYSRWDFENTQLDLGTQDWDITDSNFGYDNSVFRNGLTAAREEGDTQYAIKYPSQIPPSQDFYMGAWFYRTSESGNQWFLSAGGNSNYPALALVVNPSQNYPNILLSDAGFGDYDTGVPMPLNDWVHLGMGRNVTGGYVYLEKDGVIVYQHSYTPSSENYDIVYGATYPIGGNGGMSGYVDNAYYLPRLPTQSEMSEIVSTSSCVTPAPGIEVNQNTVFCPGTYDMTEGNILISADNIDVSCDQTVLTGWHDNQENGLTMFEMSSRENVVLHGCNVSTVRTVVNVNGGINNQIYDIEFHDVGVDVIGGQNNNGLLIHDITGESAQNGNIFVSGDDLHLYNIEGVSFIYLGYWAEGEGYAVASNVNIYSTSPEIIQIHGTDFSIHNNIANQLQILSNDVDIQNSEVYGNQFYSIQDGADYGTENINWCVGQVGNTRTEYIGSHINDGSCEPLCSPSWECSEYSDCKINPMSHRDCLSVSDANNCGEPFAGDLADYTIQGCDIESGRTSKIAYFNNVNQQKAAEQPAGIFAWINTFIMNLRKAIGLN